MSLRFFLCCCLGLIHTPLFANTAVAIFLKSEVTSANIAAIQAHLDPLAISKYYPEIQVMIGVPAAEHETFLSLQQHPDIQYLSAITGGVEELATSTAAINIRKIPLMTTDIARPYPDMRATSAFNDRALPGSWWYAGFQGKHAIAGLLDSGIANELPAFQHLKVIKYTDSPLYKRYINGVRTAHGTGVGSIMFAGLQEHPSYLGVAYDTDTLLAAHAWDSSMECTDENGVTYELPCIIGTIDSLLWMFDRPAFKQPNVVNYSFGHGPLLENYSAVARIFDHLIYQENSLIVKSAGNDGYIAPTSYAPYANTLSVPGDLYNGLVVANMNTTLEKNTASDGSGLSTLIKTADRAVHYINYTSSRGPTLAGRRKPDITAPGNDTRVYAPDPAVYVDPIRNPYFSDYPASAHYRPLDATRVVGGTSMSAPHVAGAALVLAGAGITDPVAMRALLINSAESWQPEPIDAPCNSRTAPCPQGPIDKPVFDAVFGYWDRTYGWGYMDLQKAYQQRNNIIYDTLPKDGAIHVYQGVLQAYEKATLVWEKQPDLPLTDLRFTIETADREGGAWKQQDPSRIDNVKQLINEENTPRRVRITIAKEGNTPKEPYVLVTGSLHPFTRVEK